MLVIHYLDNPKIIGNIELYMAMCVHVYLCNILLHSFNSFLPCQLLLLLHRVVGNVSNLFIQVPSDVQRLKYFVISGNCSLLV